MVYPSMHPILEVNFTPHIPSSDSRRVQERPRLAQTLLALAERLLQLQPEEAAASNDEDLGLRGWHSKWPENREFCHRLDHDLRQKWNQMKKEFHRVSPRKLDKIKIHGGWRNRKVGYWHTKNDDFKELPQFGAARMKGPKAPRK